MLSPRCTAVGALRSFHSTDTSYSSSQLVTSITGPVSLHLVCESEYGAFAQAEHQKSVCAQVEVKVRRKGQFELG